MPRKFAVQEIEQPGSKHLRLHVLWLPTVTEPDFYRQVTSFNAFFHSGGKRGLYGPNWKGDELLYSEKDWEEFENECEIWGKDLPALDYRNLPQIEHQSIWEFYESIGYDFRKKKWWLKCKECHGYGYTECVAYYYGRAECSSCDGSGYVLGSARKRQRRESVQ